MLSCVVVVGLDPVVRVCVVCGRVVRLVGVSGVDMFCDWRLPS